MANADGDERPCYLTVGGARKVKRLVDRFDGQKGNPPAPKNGGGGWTPSIVRAKVTTAIPTGSFDTPSSTGRAKISYLVDGAWTAETDAVVVFNQNVLSSSIPVGRAVFLCWLSGTWWLLQASCS